MAIIKNTKKQMLVRMPEKRSPYPLFVGMQIGATTMENEREFPQKTKNRPTV
jgi:hypothetical protein